MDDAWAAYWEVHGAEPTNVAALAGLGRISRRRGELTAALCYFERATSIDPSRIMLLRERAAILRELSRFEEAAGVLTTVLAREPQHADVRCELAGIHFQADRLDDACAAYMALHDTDPANVAVLAGLGRISRRRGDLTAALRYFERATAIDPGRIMLLRERAAILRDLSRFEEAAGVLTAVLAREPHHADARCELAALDFQAGRLDDAWAAYTAVCDADPANVAALAELGRISRRRGDLTAALRYFERATATDPGRITMLCERAAILRDLSRFDEAAGVLTAVLAREPNGLGALVGLGLLARERGDTEGALVYFQRGLEIKPDDWGLQRELAVTLRLLDRLDEAVRIYQRAADADPKAAEPIHGLSLIAEARGELQPAIALAELAVSLDPDRVSFKMQVAGLYRDSGRLDDADSLIDRSLSDHPQNAAVWMEKGHLLSARNEHALALSAYERAAAMDLDRGLMNVAAEHRALGRPDQARAVYQRILTRKPLDIPATLAIAQLEMLAANYDNCVEHCDKLIAAHPNQIGPYLLKCRALIQLGRADEAVGIVSEFDACERWSADADAARLEILTTCGRRREAQALLSLPRVATTRVFKVWSESVMTRMAFYDFVGVEAALRDPPARRPHERSRVHYVQGLLADLQWRIDDAVSSFDRALEIHPDNPGAHHQLARLQFLRADIDASYRHLHAMMRQNSAAISLRGASTNVSQNLMGQLLNELRLDDDVRTQLVNLRHEELPRRIELLLDMVRSVPRLTPPAIHLLLALRQSGAFRPLEATPAMSSAPLIPRRIVQFWDDKRPPPEIVRLLRTWEEVNPGYQYCCFDNAAARDFLKAHYPDAVLNAYRRAAHPAQASDLFRLAYLYREGGFYADADDRCVGDPSHVAPPDAVLIAYQEEYATLGNNFLGCVPGEPVIGRALELAVEALTRGDSDTIWLTTGPGLMTRAFAEIMAAQTEGWSLWLRSRRILDRRELDQISRPHSIMHYKSTRRSWLRSVFRSRVRGGSHERSPATAG